MGGRYQVAGVSANQADSSGVVPEEDQMVSGLPVVRLVFVRERDSTLMRPGSISAPGIVSGMSLKALEMGHRFLTRLCHLVIMILSKLIIRSVFSFLLLQSEDISLQNVLRE